MRKDSITVAHVPLLVHIPETDYELRKGYNLVEPVDGEGMLFIMSMHVTPDTELPMWVPIMVGKDALPLDVMWTMHGIIVAIAENMHGILQGEADAVLEVPAGWVKTHGILVGDKIRVSSMEMARRARRN